MKALKDYIIHFVGLKEGFHDFFFEVTESFFENFEHSELGQGSVEVKVRLERQKRMLIFEFDMNGYVTIPCDRCLKDMDFHVEGRERLIVKFGQESKEETEEIIIIPETASEIDISSFIYEYIMLSLPYKRVHDDGDPECKSEVTERLNTHKPEQVDERWNALKGLKDKLG
jgi:uncharacterized metal-binding protein YceD (DUF177 family)